MAYQTNETVMFNIQNTRHFNQRETDLENYIRIAGKEMSQAYNLSPGELRIRLLSTLATLVAKTKGTKSERRVDHCQLLYARMADLISELERVDIEGELAYVFQWADQLEKCSDHELAVIINYALYLLGGRRGINNED